MVTLVTGASGFVGAAVARTLIAAGHQVRVTLRTTSDTKNLEGLDVERVYADLCNPASLRSAVRGCLSLFHVAADYRLWSPDPQTFYRTNVDGTRDLMNAAVDAGIQKIVYTSSVAALGLRPNGASADETTPVRIEDMIGHYKRSKYLAEQAVLHMAQEQRLPVIIVNPSTPIGPRDIKPTPTGKIIVDAVNGNIPAYVDTGLNIVHVDDVAQGHILAFNKGEIGERYILGGENMSLRDILSTIARLAGHKAPRIRLPHNLVLPIAYLNEYYVKIRKRGEPRVTVDGVKMSKKLMYFSSAKAQSALGYTSQPVERAIDEAIRWFRNNGYCRT